jgi:hypothetical protein
MTLAAIPGSVGTADSARNRGRLGSADDAPLVILPEGRKPVDGRRLALGVLAVLAPVFALKLCRSKWSRCMHWANCSGIESPATAEPRARATATP